MRRILTLLIPTSAVALSACAVAPPPGPSVMAVPGQGKSFEAFQQDDYGCRQYAAAQTGGVPPGVAASNSAVGSAVAGTALGAAAGAAIGAAAGAAGPGAAIGAATGLIAGSAIGSNAAAASYGGVQQAYDIGYSQCMIAHGDTIQPSPSAYAGYPSGYGYGMPYGYPAAAPGYYPAPAPAYPYYGYPGYYGAAYASSAVRRRLRRRLGLGWRLGLARRRLGWRLAWRRLERRWLAWRRRWRLAWWRRRWWRLAPLNRTALSGQPLHEIRHLIALGSGRLRREATLLVPATASKSDDQDAPAACLMASDWRGSNCRRRPSGAPWRLGPTSRTPLPPSRYGRRLPCRSGYRSAA